MTEGLMNLSVPRGEKSIWDEPRWRMKRWDRDRMTAAMWGSGLAMLGARRRGFTGGVLAMLGGVVAARAALGYHDLAVARDMIDRRLHDRGWRSRDIIHEALDESFPASDPPAWSGTK